MNVKIKAKPVNKFKLQSELSYLSLLADLLVKDSYRPSTTKRKKKVQADLKQMLYKSQQCLQMIEKNASQSGY